MESYLTIEELAGYLKIAEQTIRRWVQNREIPFHKIKKSIRFRVSEIEWWIENGSVISCSSECRDSNCGFVPDVISLDELREEEEKAEMASEEVEE